MRRTYSVLVALFFATIGFMMASIFWQAHRSATILDQRETIAEQRDMIHTVTKRLQLAEIQAFDAWLSYQLCMEQKRTTTHGGGK